ncbi:MAG: hypothetical protein ACR2MG_09825 [Pyrinomonadaceae bacterium]
MKYRLIFFVVGVIFFLGLASISYMQNSKEHFLEITVKPSKDVYLLGEVVPLDILVKNKGAKSTKIFGGLATQDGSFSVSISRNNKTFKKYNYTNWGRADTKRKPIELDSGESVSNLVTVFWNNKPKISDSLAPNAIKQATEGKILTDYAFPESGDYYVKVSYFMYFTAEPILLESEPIKITIEKPVGENLEVWNKIKDNGEIAYFIQEGDFHIPSYKTEEREKLKQEIEQIINQYPNSFYAESLQQSLEKFQAVEAKRQESLQKLKQKQP